MPNLLWQLRKIFLDYPLAAIAVAITRAVLNNQVSD